MIDIIPFHGLLYSIDITGLLEEVTARPSDPISQIEQEALYHKKPSSFIQNYYQVLSLIGLK
tara:strand:- start:125 stop:310 length:186 start_codon:yes stop_codon:yes gene_type:complete